MKDILTGKTQKHLLQDFKSTMLIHHEVRPALEKLRKSAATAGFSLELASSFRSFEQQLGIWNSKAKGLKALYNDQGDILDYNSLSPVEIVYAILRWSALPGASRHHWGTDIDVYDKSRIPADYKVQLIPSETVPGGVFGEFHLWLDENLKNFDFYRPYSVDDGGIAPEKWHISYAPVSKIYQEALSIDVVAEAIQNAEIELKPIILRELPEIYQRFINLKIGNHTDKYHYNV